jgi:predicted dehydrogenase
VRPRIDGPIRTAVIGAGGICEEHLSKLGMLDGVEVVGLCDRSPIVAVAVAERFGVRPYVDAQEMLDRERPDVVHVITPPATHRGLVEMALAAGAHVVVEKPIALSHQEYADMQRLAAERQLLLIEVQNYRFNDAVRRAETMLARGELGQLVHVSVRYATPLGDGQGAYADRGVAHFGHALPGGALFNFVSHPACMLSRFVGPALHVYPQRRRMGNGTSDDELTALVVGELATGSVLVSSHVRPLGFTVQLECTHGVALVDVYEGTLRVEPAGGAMARLATGVVGGAGAAAASVARVGRAAIGRHDWFEGLERMLGEFYVAVRSGAPPPITAGDLDASVRLVDDLMEQGARG